MLAKKRENRPESFHEVLKALNSIRIFKTEPAKKNNRPLRKRIAQAVSDSRR